MGPLILLVFLVLWILLCWSLCVICWSPWFWCIFYLFCIFFKRSWGFLISECWVCLIIGFDSFIYSFKGLVFVAAAFSVDVHVVELLYMVNRRYKILRDGGCHSFLEFVTCPLEKYFGFFSCFLVFYLLSFTYILDKYCGVSITNL